MASSCGSSRRNCSYAPARQSASSECSSVRTMMRAMPVLGNWAAFMAGNVLRHGRRVDSFILTRREETPVPRLIRRDPFFDRFERDIARRRKRPALSMQPCGGEKQELLLLLRRQRFGGLFDLGERAHAGEGSTPRGGSSSPDGAGMRRISPSLVSRD